jgi:hypothetical protein
MKLSRTAWNNVIIFSVMAFILLINMTNKQLFSPNDKPDNTQQALLGEHAVIFTLNVHQQIIIERIGRTWRANPTKISGQALEQMMLAWQEVRGTPLNTPPDIDQQMGLVVTIEVAGKNQPQVLSLYATANEFLIFNQYTEQWLILPLPIFQQLIPAEILATF